MFNQSIQFIFSHVLTSDKLEPFERLLFIIINVSIGFIAHYETLRNKLQKPKTKTAGCQLWISKKNRSNQLKVKKKEKTMKRPKTGWFQAGIALNDCLGPLKLISQLPV